MDAAKDIHEISRRDDWCSGRVLDPNVTQECADVFRAQGCEGPFFSGAGSVVVLVAELSR
jgi:hypothetical protein